MLRKLYKFLGIHQYILSKKILDRWNLPKYSETSGKKFKYDVHFKISKKYDEYTGKLLSRSVKIEIGALFPELIFFKNKFGSLEKRKYFLVNQDYNTNKCQCSSIGLLKQT